MSKSLPDAPQFPFKRERAFDPPLLYARARESRPIFPVTLWDGRRAYLLTRYGHLRAVVLDPRFSGEFGRADFPAVTEARVAIDKQERAFVGMDNPQHDHYRRMLSGEFTVKRMLALKPRIEQITNELIDDMLSCSPPVDFITALAQKFPALVMCDLFGSPYEDHEFIMACAAGRHGLSQTPEQARTSAQALVEYAAQLIAKKIRRPGNDMISRIVDEYVKPGKLSVEEFAHIGAMLLRAGHDTTANMIALGTLLLLQTPAQLTALRHDWSLIDAAVEELLRYLSPVQFAPRRVALEDVEIDGIVIKKGEGVFGLTPAANRDPTMFQDPDRFDVRRNAGNHCAFGYGIHQCLGQMLARFELRTVFPALFQRIPTLELAVPVIEIRFKDDSQIYGIYAMPVRW